MAYLAVIVLVVVALFAGGAWMVVRTARGSAGVPTGVPAAAPQQPRTLLVGLADGSGLVAGALLGTGDGPPSCVAVPGALVVDDGTRRVRLTQAATGAAASGGAETSGGGAGIGAAGLGAAGIGAAAAALARSLDVPVDAGWLLDGQALATLVDAGGGVVVDVDRELRSGPVLVAAGRGQRLTGPQAVAYVSVARLGEPATASAQRWADVLGQVLAALPGQAPQVHEALAGLGQGSVSTLSGERLAALLTDRGQAIAAAGALAVTALPVTASPPGQEPGGVAADRGVAGDLVRRALGVGREDGESAGSGAAAPSTGG